MGLQLVEGFSKQAGVVVVAGGDHELLAAGSRQPEPGWPWERLGAVLEGQFQPEALESDLAVLGLRSALCGLCGDARGLVGEHDGGLGFISMLAARSRSTGVKLLGLLQEVGRREGGGVHGDWIGGVQGGAVFCTTAGASSGQPGRHVGTHLRREACWREAGAKGPPRRRAGLRKR